MFDVIEFTGGPMPLRLVQSFSSSVEANKLVSLLKEQSPDKVFYIYSYEAIPHEYVDCFCLDH